MDKTELFKAVVKTVRLRLRAQNRETGSINETLFTKRGKETSEFAKLAKTTCSHITAIKQFLLTNRRNYIDSASHLSQEFSQMTDSERDLIDNEAQELIKKATEYLSSLHKISHDSSCSDQCLEHRKSVLELIELYLKGVTKLFNEQKAVRIKRIVDRKRTIRLVPESRRHFSGNTSQQSFGINERLEEPITDPPSSPVATTTQQQSQGISSISEEVASPHNSSIEQNRVELNSSSNAVSAAAQYNTDFTYDSTFSPEEMEDFKQENALVLDHMTSLVDEVRKIEGKVVEITRLQEVFTENVLKQAEQIEVVYKTTVMATEDISQGNEKIRSAIRNQGSLRMWILFILVVCSFTLLFLDWYS